jgi:hypothetical protein
MQIQWAAPSCQAVVDGTSATAGDGKLNFSYVDSTGKLDTSVVRGNLHFYNVSGCAGLWNTGNQLTISGNFTVSPKQSIITIP